MSTHPLNTMTKDLEKLDSLPPIISGMIMAMRNKSNDMYLRDNYCASLENIVATCGDEISKFRREQTKTNYEIRSDKKRKK